MPAPFTIFATVSVAVILAAAGAPAIADGVAPQIPGTVSLDPADAPLSTSALLQKATDAFQVGDHARANVYLRQLAQRDIASAETLLGTMAINGQGVPKNDAVGAAWFLRAANRGYAPAQLALADAFARGRGVPQDIERARALSAAAAAQGYPGAQQFVGHLGTDHYAMAAATAGGQANG